MTQQKKRRRRRRNIRGRGGENSPSHKHKTIFHRYHLLLLRGTIKRRRGKKEKAKNILPRTKKNVLGKKSEQTPCFPSKPNLKGREQALTFPPTFLKKVFFPGFGFHASFSTCSFPSYSSSFSGWTHLSWVGREMSSRFAATAEEEEEEKATTTHNAREQKCGIRQHWN